MKIRRSVVVFSLVLTLIIVIMLYFIPLPSQVSISMHGVALAENDTIIDEGKITLRGWKLNYLLKSDELLVQQFQILDQSFTNDQNAYTLVYFDSPNNYERIRGLIYNLSNKELNRIYMCLDIEGNRCYIELEGLRYIGSTEEGFNPLEISENMGRFS